jgi:serine/threonine protein kinase
VALLRNDSNTKSKSITNCISSGTGICGTAGYVCPEYARTMGQYPYPAACDIFSLGVVLVEMICGQVQSQNVEYFRMYVMEKNTLSQRADPSVEWQSNILDPLCKMALRCMPSTPQERPSSQDIAEVDGTSTNP